MCVKDRPTASQTWDIFVTQCRRLLNYAHSVGEMNRLSVASLINPLDSKGNYSATSNNTKLVHWPLMGGLLHLVQRGGDWAWPSVPITVLLYDGPLFCGLMWRLIG